MCLSVSRAAPCYFLPLSRRHPAWWSRRRRDTYSPAHLLSRAGTHTEVSSDTTTRSFLRSFAFTVAFFLGEETAQSVRVLLTRPRCCASLSTATPCMHVGGLFSFFQMRRSSSARRVLVTFSTLLFSSRFGRCVPRRVVLACVSVRRSFPGEDGGDALWSVFRKTASSRLPLVNGQLRRGTEAKRSAISRPLLPAPHTTPFASTPARNRAWAAASCAATASEPKSDTSRFSLLLCRGVR